MKKLIFAFIISAGLLLQACSSTTTPAETPVNNPPQSGTSDTPAPEVSASDHVVAYTDSGYSPKSLTVKKGETVTWKNQSSGPMWTASANHPTHTVYPTTGGCLGSTFDACKGVKSGDEWSFTFGETGSWGYHNHLKPIDTGTVVVE